MTKLSVNINKLATLRNARGGQNPNLAQWAQKIESYGAYGITVHPRPDERHIKKQDVFELAPLVQGEFNIEGYPSKDFLNLISEVKPAQCTLVPDPPEVLTSNAGWKVQKQTSILEGALKVLEPLCRVSVFVEPDSLKSEDVKILKRLNVERCELYTEEFAKNHQDAKVLQKYRKCADLVLSEGLELNAGHDLDLQNLSSLMRNLPEIKEVSIGHALICESLELGMEETIKRYLDVLKGD